MRARTSDASPTLTRREFVKNTVTTSFAAAALTRMPQLTALPQDPVLILGGGAAGLAAAYELQKAGIPFRILEASTRVGGRIFTQTGFTEDGQFIERGGELIDTDHKAILQMAKELGVTVERLDGDAHGLAQSLYSLRGHVYTEDDLTLHLKPLIRAVNEARAQGAGHVTYQDGLKGNGTALRWDRMTLQEFLDGLHGRVIQWVRDMAAIGYMGEFGRPASEISMLALTNLIADVDGGIYGPSDETLRFSGGNSSFIEKLRETLESRTPGCLELGAHVGALHERSSGKLKVTYQQDGMTRELVSSRVICTLPFTTLRFVEGLDRLPLSPQKHACIARLMYGFNSKSMLEFSSRRWRHADGKLPAYTGAISGDFPSQSFWETSRMQPGSHGVLTCFQGGATGLAASRQQVHSQLLPDLDKFHPAIGQEYVKSAVQNWNLEPLAGGSYACLLAGQYSEINGAQAEPELNGRLLFAGEHCSDESQGYMNGAVETGVAAAQEIIKKMASALAV